MLVGNMNFFGYEPKKYLDMHVIIFEIWIKKKTLLIHIQQNEFM
jgi:hypothetical protein